MSLLGLLKRDKVYDRHAIDFPLKIVAAHITSGTSGYYQATTYINKIHRISSAVDILFLCGTGTAGNANAGFFLAAGQFEEWRPIAGIETIYYKLLDPTTDTAFSGTQVLTIGVPDEI